MWQRGYSTRSLLSRRRVDTLMLRNKAKYLLSLPMAIVFVWLTSTPVAANASWQTPKTAEEFNNRGLDRQNSCDLDGALADYSKAIELDPSHALAHSSRGVVKVDEGTCHNAIKRTQLIIRLQRIIRTCLISDEVPFVEVCHMQRTQLTGFTSNWCVAL